MNNINFVLGGRIDHAHHSTNAYRALMDTIAFADAVQVAVDITSERDTLIVVTADHSHVFTMGGHANRGHNILGRLCRVLQKHCSTFPLL